MQYKSKNTLLAKDKISPPNNFKLNNMNRTMQYIKNTYQNIYKAEEISQKEANFFTQDLSSISETQNILLKRHITEEEVQKVLTALPNYKAPGPDGFSYEFYKEIQEEALPTLTGLFNYCLETGTIPRSWSKNIITLIPKKSDNLNDVNNWRPISLTNSDMKIFMKILANRVNEICDTIIGPAQQAFIKSRSIVDSFRYYYHTKKSE